MRAFVALADADADDSGSGSDGAETDALLDLAPSLRALVETEGLNGKKLSVAVEVNGDGQIRVLDRHAIQLFDGAKFARWHVSSLRELYRGQRSPPASDVMNHYPREYRPHFYVLEGHLLTLCNARPDRGAPTDQEMESIYSALRRRPDGRSLGPIHEFLWQVSALLLGTRVLSQAEFEAIVGQLERSTRKWAVRPVSRYYAQYLTEHLGND